MKTRKIIHFTAVIIMAALLAVSASGCSRAADVTVTEADNGSQIEVKVGSTIDVTLPSSPTTGFNWEVQDLDANLFSQVGEGVFKPESDLLGASGMLTLSFKALAAGEGSLKLIYHRAFEKDIPPEKTFSIEVTIK